MTNRVFYYIQLLICAILFLQTANGSILDYFIPKAFTKNSVEKESSLNEIPNVLYELNLHEEKFLLEAQQLIGEIQSKLDMCQHRVIHKLKKSCHQLNAEDLGRLAVMLLNCQLVVENRSLFECTEKMELKDCTQDMDGETWNSYQLFTNRVKAACIVIRHQQFKAATELTVNKLMASVHDQQSVMKQLTNDQTKLRDVATNIIDELAENSGQIFTQQKDVIRLSEDHRIKLENNIRDLKREQQLIRSGQMDVGILLTKIKQKIDEATNDLSIQTENSQNSRTELINDLDKLQESAKQIIDKLDTAIVALLKHNEIVSDQYQNTLIHLERINSTIFALAGIMKDFNVEKLLNWFNETITENEYFAKKLKVTMLHLCYLLMGMLCFAFLNADQYIRLFFIITVSLNFIGIAFDYYIINMLTLTISMFLIILCYVIVKNFRKLNFKINSKDFIDDTVTDNPPLNLSLIKEKNNNEQTSNFNRNYVSHTRTIVNDEKHTIKPELFTRNIRSLRRSMTPIVEPLYDENDSESSDTNNSRSSSRRSGTPSIIKLQCDGMTQKNQKCRLNAIHGTKYCTLHMRPE